MSTVIFETASGTKILEGAEAEKYMKDSAKKILEPVLKDIHKICENINNKELDKCKTVNPFSSGKTFYVFEGRVYCRIYEWHNPKYDVTDAPDKERDKAYQEDYAKFRKIEKAIDKELKKYFKEKDIAAKPHRFFDPSNGYRSKFWSGEAIEIMFKGKSI